LTQIKEGLIKSQSYTHVVMNTDDSISSQDKKPSPELFSLIKAAATNLLGFGELWGSIKKKGHDEGFTEKELQEMLRPHLKQKLDSKKVWYLFHADEQKKRSHEQYQNRTNISTNDVKKDIEKTSTRDHDEEPEDIPEIIKTLPVKDSTQFYAEQKPDDKWLGERGGGMGQMITEEDPKDIQIQFLKEKVAELEEALKKTQQFKPATQLQEIDIVNNVVVRCGIEAVEKLIHNEMAGMRNRGWKTVEVTMRVV